MTNNSNETKKKTETIKVAKKSEKTNKPKTLKTNNKETKKVSKSLDKAKNVDSSKKETKKLTKTASVTKKDTKKNLDDVKTVKKPVKIAKKVNDYVVKENDKLNIDNKVEEISKESLVKKEKTKDIAKKETFETNDEAQKQSFINSNKTLIIISILLIIALVIGIYANNTKTKTYSLSKMFPEFTDSANISLPNNYYLTDQGGIILIDGDYAINIGGIYAFDDTENEYESTMEYYATVMNVEDVTIGDRDYKKLTQESEDGILHYYYTKYDTYVIQAAFLNLDDTKESELLNSIK